MSGRHILALLRFSGYEFALEAAGWGQLPAVVWVHHWSWWIDITPAVEEVEGQFMTRDLDRPLGGESNLLTDLNLGEGDPIDVLDHKIN